MLNWRLLDESRRNGRLNRLEGSEAGALFMLICSYEVCHHAATDALSTGD